MTGYHEVQVFPVNPESSAPQRLPEGWKPFAAYIGFSKRNQLDLYVVARRWNRAEPTPEGESPDA